MRIKTLTELSEFLDKGNIIIYGAGKVSRTVVKWALKEKKKIQSIIVSQKSGNPEEIFGLKVYGLDEVNLNNESNILIAVMEKNQPDIEMILNDYNINFYVGMLDTVYWKIESLIADYDIEQIQLLEWLVKNYQDDKSKCYWHHDFEKKITLENWGNVYDSDKFKERYFRLIRGLDDESVETVIRIINRQKIYMKDNSNMLDLFTAYEKKELKKQEDDFWSLIIKLDDDLYMYKNYMLTSNDFEPSVFYYKHGISKVKDVDRLRGGVFIDVGGYVGDSALVLQELEPSRIYTFEGLPEHCDKIKNNMKLNGVDNVIIENTALGNTKGYITMEICGSSSNAIQRKGIPVERKIEVPVTTLDEYVERNNITDIRLIKVDIEGSEPYFLEGAKNTITQYRPLLLLSIYHNEHDFFELKPMIEEWGLNYKFTIYKSINGNITNETVLIAEVV